MKKALSVFAIFVFAVVGIYAQAMKPLDNVIEEAAKSVGNALPQGTKLAVLNFTSVSETFSDYVIEELTGALVTGKKVTIVDRRELALIRNEMNLQLSGDVSDESARAIGKQLGAQSIVSGSLTNLGTHYRFRIKVINVETAEIQIQPSFNLQNDAQTAFLLGVTPPVATTPSANTPASAQTAAFQDRPGLYSDGTYIPHQETPAPRPQISSDRPGLYVNGAYQGQKDLMDAVDWISLNAKSGGNYVIVLGKDDAAPYITLSYNNQQVSITLKATGGERRVRYEVNSPTYSLFTVGPGVTFTLEDGVVLTGLQRSSKPLVRVTGGTFVMNGGSIRDNSASESGGGVHIESGTFTMNNGTISGNSSSYGVGGGGGVYIAQGTFTMKNGTISGNSTNGNGGGVCLARGACAFAMQGGTISGNSTNSYGGGVYVNSSATFTKSGSGGIIYGSNAPDGQANKAYSDGYGHAVYVNSSSKRRNTTARVSNAIDTGKSGAAGGWE